MKKVLNFVKGKRDERVKINPQISVEITNPSGQKITSDDEHIVGLQQGYGYNIDVNGKDRAMLKIHKAAWFGQLDKLKLHSKKCDVNTVDSMNRTCLHLAVAQGHTEVAWYLLNNNASITACDSDGLTPFLKAIECGHKDCTNLLIECGADVNTTDKTGHTGLHLAARSGFYNIASLLLKEGANLNIPNNDGEYALHLATSSDHREIVELFLRCGANVDVQDRERRTPLMIAARAGLTTIIKVLLDNGANCEAADSNGWTAEDYAQFGGHQDLMEMLQTKKEEPGLDGSDKLSIQSSDQSEHVNFENPPTDEKPDESQLSPPSCVIPPALDPPRSWDLIQSGAIDQERTDIRKRTLTLVIKPSSEVSDCNELMATSVEFASSTLSPSGDAIPSEMRLSPEPASLVPTPERRTRSPLERAHSLDLPSDQDSPILGYSPEELNKNPAANDNKTEDPVVSVNENNNNYNINGNSFSPKNQIFCDDNFLTTFKQLSKQTTADIDNYNLLKTNLRSTNDFDDNTYTMESSQSCDNLDGKSLDTDNFCTGVSSSLDNIDEIEVKSLSIEIIQSTGNLDDTLSVCTTSKTMFRETHSLELLDDDRDPMRQHKNKRHVRNKSITLTGQPQIWKSVEALPKHQLANVERGSIDAQLVCYDKALEQLAEASIKVKNEATVVIPPPEMKSNDNTMVCHLGTPPDEFKMDLMDSLESETSFPPPPVHFLQNDDSDAIEVNFEERNDLLDDCLRIPISMLTPIKETQIECDSLSNADCSNDNSIHERINMEASSSHFNVEVIVNNKSPEMSQSFGDSTPRCIQTPDNSFHLSRDVFLDDSTLTEHYGKYIVDVKALELQPTSVDLNKIEIPADSPSPTRLFQLNSGDEKTSIRRKRKLQRGAGMGSGSKESGKEVGGACNEGVETATASASSTRDSIGGDDDDDEDDEDSDEEDPPFWQNTDKGGFFMRQNTVVPAVATFPKLISATGKEDNARLASRIISKVPASRGNSDGSSDAETVSASDTPRQFAKGSFHAHLREATLEKGKLEETAASLLGKAERLKYELEDSRQAEAARDDTITVLQNQLTRLECRYAKAQEELCTQRQRASSAENELQHLRELCANLSKDKAEMYRELSKQLNQTSKPDLQFQQSDEFSQKHLHLMIKHLEDSKKLEEEKNLRLVHHLEEVLLTNQNMISEREALIAQNIADVRKLQEDTICWKDRYEELAAKLEMMDKKQDPRLIEAQDTIATLKRTINLLQQEKCYPKQHDATTNTASPKTGTQSVKPSSMGTVPCRATVYETALIELTAMKLELDGLLTSDFKMAVMASLPTRGCAEEDKIESLLDSESAKIKDICGKVSGLLKEIQATNSIRSDYENMRNLFELEFMSKKDYGNLKDFHEEALNKLKKEGFSESHLELTEKLAHITELLQRQIQEQARIERARTNSEISLRQKFEHISNVIQSELTEIQATIKESEEHILKKRLEQMTNQMGNSKEKSLDSRSDKYDEAVKSATLSEKLKDLPQEFISRSVNASDNSQSIEERFTEDLKEKYSLNK